jgi:hypothetical protein
MSERVLWMRKIRVSIGARRSTVTAAVAARSRPLPAALRRSSAVAAVACLLFAAGAAHAASKVDHEAECTYKRLTWDDFRGPIMNGQQVAWIMATIVLDPVRVELVEREGGGTIAQARNPSVYALMNKLQSSAQVGGRTERNLAHEQIHFDLVEYLARRLSRELRDMRVEGAARSEDLQRELLVGVQKRYNETLADLERLQQQYDGETSHGRRSGEQRKWGEKAASLLASEKPYELR